MTPKATGEETRSRILKAAEECFARYGYDATGVAEICRRAGVSKGAFYHHFPSKQALFLEMLEGWLGEIEIRVRQIRSQAENVPDGLIRMAETLEQIFRAARGRLPLFLEFWTKAAHDQAVWQATIEPYREYRAFFAEMLRQGIAEGTIKPVDPEKAGRVIVSLAVGLVLQGLLDPEGADWGETAREGVKILLEGLARRDQQ